MVVVVTGAIATLTLVGAIARRIAGPFGSKGLAEAAFRNRVAGNDATAQRALEELREEVEQLRGEVGELRARSAELDDVQNRLDFAERMLAQARERNALPGGRS